MNDKILVVDNVSRHFGGVKALSSINLFAKREKITGLIGPNGAGKTTLFNLMTGIDKANEGTITFNNQTLNNLSPAEINRLGIARTFQNIRLFKEMTVLENILMGTHSHIFSDTLHPFRFLNAFHSLLHIKKINKIQVEKAIHWLEFFNLTPFCDDLSSSLPYGKQRLLEIARALATEPQLLFLDEPAAGMNHTETNELMEAIDRILQLGVTVILIEHDMKLVMNICHNLFVLNYGELIAQGDPTEVRNNPDVIKAYLGDEINVSH